MSHYYKYDPNVKSDVHEVGYTYHGHRLSLLSDHGIFSKERVDFGTNILLNTIEGDPTSILDVGCGYGIIGCSLALRYSKAQVEMVDVNERAVELAKMNVERNKIHNAIVFSGSLYESVTRTYDWIVSNPPIRAGKRIVHQIVEQGYPFLNAGGSLWVVIQKKQGAASLFEKMEEIFQNVEVVKKQNGYWIIRSIK